MLRRSLVVSVLSAALVRSLPAKAQEPSDDEYFDWLDDDYGGGASSAEEEALRRACSTRVEFDGYRIAHALRDRILDITATFSDAGFSLDYQADEDGVRDFVRAKGDITPVRFLGVRISTAYFATFAAAFFTEHGMSAPIVLRADNLDTGDSVMLKATISTGEKLTSSKDEALKYKVELENGRLMQGRFRKMVSGDGRIMVSLGCYIDRDERWYLIKRRIYSNPRLERSLASSSRTFAEGLQSVDFTACRQRCFLTTACCEAFGKPDDCYELETLRAFRNGWLRFQPGGVEAIATYGVVAPIICAALARDPRRDLQLARIYWGTIVPCLALIRLGLRRPAYALYRRLVTRLMARYAVA